MKKLVIVLIGLALNSVALAGTSTYVEGAYISGGENGENGSGEESGLELAGGYALSELWYVGGVLGSYERDDSNTDNDYINFHGGAAIGFTEKTDMIVELGLWLGEQKTSGFKTEPTSLEFKIGVNTTITEKLGLFATISLIAGDLDTPSNSDLQNFVWSAGGAYSFTPNLLVNLKLVEGSNGVNGQSDVIRAGVRWTF